MKFLFENYASIPAVVIDVLAHTADLRLDATSDHAPHRVVPILYGTVEGHIRLMALNGKSPLSFRQGDVVHLYDRTLMETLDGR